jgi:hypothetical protein
MSVCPRVLYRDHVLVLYQLFQYFCHGLHMLNQREQMEPYELLDK